MFIHGMRKTPTYNSWDSMIARCYRPSNPDYEHYGGRGIIVCERWKIFNCQWLCITKQQANRRNNVFVIFNGGSYPVSTAAKLAGLNVGTVWQRYNKGIEMKNFSDL